MNSGACLYGGTCQDGVNKYTCHCATGFSGNNCEKTPDYCSVKNCLGNTCYNSLDDRSGICECEFPYYNSSGMFFLFQKLGEKATYLQIKHFSTK